MQKSIWSFGVGLVTLALPEFFPMTDALNYIVVGIGLLLMMGSAISFVAHKYGLRFDRLWHDYKPWGVSICFDEPVCLGGNVNDPRYCMFRAKVKNNTKRWLTVSDCHAKNSITGERLSGFYNTTSREFPERGTSVPIADLQGLPPKSEGYLQVHLCGDFRGGSLNAENYPRVEEAAQAWPEFTFNTTINGRAYQWRFAGKRHMREINAALDELRSRNQAKLGLTKKKGA